MKTICCKKHKNIVLADDKLLIYDKNYTYLIITMFSWILTIFTYTSIKYRYHRYASLTYFSGDTILMIALFFLGCVSLFKWIQHDPLLKLSRDGIEINALTKHKFYAWSEFSSVSVAEAYSVTFSFRNELKPIDIWLPFNIKRNNFIDMVNTAKAMANNGTSLGAEECYQMLKLHKQL